MKNKRKVLNIFLILLIVILVFFITRPCSIRPFQNKSCAECGFEEGEKQAVRDWNARHTKEYQVK